MRGRSACEDCQYERVRRWRHATVAGGSVASFGPLRARWVLRKRIQSFIRSSLWIVPAISTLAALVFARTMHIVDNYVNLPWFRYSSEGTRALASLIVAAMLSFIVFFFSVLLVTVQLASSTLSPRIIARPFRSKVLKRSLGLFAFTLIYSMAIVGRVSDEHERDVATFTIAVLTIASVCVFLYVVEYISKQLRPVTVMSDVALEGLNVIKAVYPSIIAHQSDYEESQHQVSLENPSRIVCHNGRPGVVQAMNVPCLIDAAVRGSCVIEVVPQVGDFVAAGDAVFRIYGDVQPVAEQDLLGNILLDRERTLEQDPAFAFRIIVDIAAKALSPAINDPTTAVLALDQIHPLLREVGLRRLDTGLVHDGDGHLRVVYRTPNWEDFVALAVTEIRQFGAGSTQVVRRMRAMLKDLIPLLPAVRAAELQRQLDLLKSTTDRGFSVPQDRQRAELADSQGLGGRADKPTRTERQIA
jgi:uncharacterized membrane protein